MKRSIPILFLVLGFIAIACNLFTLAQVDADTEETALAQSVDATLTANAPAPSLPASPTRLSAPTHTPKIAMPTITNPTSTLVPEHTATPREPFISEILFSTEYSDESIPKDTTSEFDKDTKEVNAYFSYCGIPAGSRITRYWILNGKEVVSRVFSFTDSCGDYRLSISGSGNSPLDPGMWELNIFVGNKLMQSGKFRILR